MNTLALDPGNTHSAYVILEGERITHGYAPNAEVLGMLADPMFRCDRTLVVEAIASFGMAVGAEIFETCIWSGRMIQAWDARRAPWDRLYRQDIKLHLCGTPRAKDGNIRQALLDRYGGKAAIGKKKTPGPLYGVSGDVWSALAVGLAWQDGVRSKINGAA